MAANNEDYALRYSDKKDIENLNSQAELNLDDIIEESHDQVVSVDQKAIRHYVHRASTELSDEKELEIDNSRLEEIVSDAGKYAFGVIAVEVWVLDEYEGYLKIPKGGWYLEGKQRSKEHFYSLEQSEPISPGVCLAGTLWSESHSRMAKSTSQHSLQGMVKSVSRRSIKGMVDNFSTNRFHQSNFSTNRFHHHNNFSWRDINSILLDPDKSKTNRIETLINAGIGLATSCSFEVSGHKGIVIYFANTDTKMNQLSTTENMVYIQRASDLIGAMVAVTDARRASVFSKRKAHKDSSGHLAFETENKTDSEQDDSKNKISQILSVWVKKCQGGKLQIPPAMNFSQSVLTMIGVFFGLLTLSAMNEYVKLISEDDFYLIMGPFGALMTLQYGLTAAPASQPRNAIFGQTIAGFIALCFTYIPESILPIWLRVAIAPAFSIMAMVKLGVPHPPAGAHSVIYASGGGGWIFYFIVVLATMISVIPATFINNISRKRQYPTYWGNGFLIFPFRFLYFYFVNKNENDPMSTH